MTKTALSKSMRRLPVSERLELLDELQMSIAKDDARIPLYAWQKKILDQRMAAYRKNPEQVISGDEFRAKMRSEIRRLRATRRRKSA